MSTNEEYVRNVWTGVSYCSREETNSCCGPSVFIWPFTGKWTGEFRADSKPEVFAAAAAFTREREEQVRQLREEVDSTKSNIRWFDQGGQHEDKQQSAIHHRILARLEAELTRLTAGMKEAAPEQTSAEKAGE